MGMRKHARSGCHRGNTKSPRFRHAQKLEVEKIEIKDRGKIREPSSSVSELFEKYKP